MDYYIPRRSRNIVNFFGFLGLNYKKFWKLNMVRNEFIVKLDDEIINKLKVIASHEKININQLIEKILEKSIPENRDD